MKASKKDKRTTTFQKQGKPSKGKATHPPTYGIEAADTPVVQRKKKEDEDLKKKLPVQAKLKMGQPGDKYEQEADEMADKVVKGNPADFPLAKHITPLVQTKSEDGLDRIPSDIESKLNASKVGGFPLPKDTRIQIEQAFGTDFSDVRIHKDSEAVKMNEGLGAKAFTLGKDVYFNKGEFSPESREGKELLGHELGHVVQQGGADKIQTKMMNDTELTSNRTILLTNNDLVKNFRKNFEYQHKDETGLTANLAIELLPLRREYGDEFWRKIVHAIHNCNRSVGINLEKGMTYKYHLAANFKGHEIEWIRIIMLSPFVYNYDYDENKIQDKKVEDASIIENTKKLTKDLDWTLSKFDKWCLKWLEFFAPNFPLTHKVKNLRATIKPFKDAIGKTLKNGKIIEESAKLVDELNNLMKFSAGSPKAAEEFVKLGVPAGNLLKAISKIAPIGAKQFLDALGEAAIMFPKFVDDIKRAFDPKTKVNKKDRPHM